MGFFSKIKKAAKKAEKAIKGAAKVATKIAKVATKVGGIIGVPGASAAEEMLASAEKTIKGFTAPIKDGVNSLPGISGKTTTGGFTPTQAMERAFGALKSPGPVSQKLPGAPVSAQRTMIMPGAATAVMDPSGGRFPAAPKKSGMPGLGSTDMPAYRASATDDDNKVISIRNKAENKVERYKAKKAARAAKGK